MRTTQPVALPPAIVPPAAHRRAGTGPAVWLGLLVVLAGTSARAQEPQVQGRFVSLPPSLTGDTINRIVQTIEDEFLRQRKLDPKREFKVVFDFNPEGKPSASNDYHDCLKLADGIKRLQQERRIQTIAFVSGEVSRHSVLPVLACQHLVMSKKARLGPVLREDSSQPSDGMKLEYLRLATRLSANPDLVTKLFDKHMTIVPSRKGGWVNDTSPDAAGGRPLFEAGKVAVFDFKTAKEVGLCDGDARETRKEVADAYGLPREALQENPLNEQVIAWRLPVTGEVDAKLKEQLERRVRKALANKANLIILELHCHDGDTAVANSIAEFLLNLNRDREDRPVLTIAYVAPDAQNTAVYLALGCNYIVMDGKASLGNFGNLLRDKSDDEVRAIGDGIEKLAEQRHYPPALARAFVDRGVLGLFYVQSAKGSQESAVFTKRQLDEEREQRLAFWGAPEPIPLDQDKLLTLSAEDAMKYGVAYKVADRVEDIYAHYGVNPARVRVLGSDWLDELADFLRNDWTKYLLVMIGITCLLLELKMPGMGLPGVIAALCFVLFFWSHFQLGGGQVTWLAVLLFLLGLMLLAIEIFVLPGFGVCGISGVLLIISSLGLVAYGQWPSDGAEWIALSKKLAPFGLTLMGSVVLAILLARYLPSIPFINRILLKPQVEEGDGPDSVPDAAQQRMAALLGAIGVAATPLRPAGKVQFGDDYVDVLAEGTYVVPGTRVQVIEIEGNRVVVKPV